MSKKERNTREGEFWICLECRKCPNCQECKNCKEKKECNNKKTKCNNVVWTDMTKDKWLLAKERKRNCDKCWERHKEIYILDNSYDYCFLCMKIHRKSVSKSCYCHGCEAWVHTRCDKNADTFYKTHKNKKNKKNKNNKYYC